MFTASAYGAIFVPSEHNKVSSHSLSQKRLLFVIIPLKQAIRDRRRIFSQFVQTECSFCDRTGRSRSCNKHYFTVTSLLRLKTSASTLNILTGLTLAMRASVSIRLTRLSASSVCFVRNVDITHQSHCWSSLRRLEPELKIKSSHT